MRRIVVGVDGTRGWSTVVESAAEVARGSGASLQIVHVVPDGMPSPSRERLQFTLVRELSRLVFDVDHRAVVLPGEPHMVLRRAAGEADLLVVGSRGATSGRRLILGTTAQSLLHGHGCPVLVVRDVDRERAGRGDGEQAAAMDRGSGGHADVGTFGGQPGSIAPATDAGPRVH